MASTTGWNISTEPGATGNDQSTNNSSGFNAFPEGYRTNNGLFDFEGAHTWFWSSTATDATYASDRALRFSTNYMFRSYRYKQNGFSVRFVKDN